MWRSARFAAMASGRDRRLVAVLGIAAAGLITAGIVLGMPFGSRHADSAVVPYRVVVIPFGNHTGDSALAALGQIAADWITQGLMHTGLVEVISSPAMALSRQAVLQEGMSRGDQPLWTVLARETRAGTAVWGGYWQHGDSIIFQATASSLRDHHLLGTVGPFAASVAEPMAGIETLRQRAMGLLASQFDPRAASDMIKMRRPPTYEAYLAFIEGLEALDRSLDESARHFYRAAALDSTFVTAQLTALRSLVNIRRWSGIDSIVRKLARSRDQLSPSERYELEAWQAHLRGDREAACRARRRVAELAPDDWSVSLHASSCMRVGRYRETVDTYRQLDPDRGLVVVWPWQYWKNLTASLHFLGRHDEELTEAREAIRRYPEDPSYLNPEAHALAALDRAGEAEKLLDRCEELAPDRCWSFMWILSREFRLHSHVEAASQMFERAIVRLRAHLREGEAGRGYRSALASALYQAGRYDEAQVLVRELAAEQPRSAYYAGWLGTLAARLRDHPEALRMAEELRTWDGEYLFGQQTLWRARIAAILGERDEAVKLIRQALQEGFGHELLHLITIVFESLAGYEPYEELVRPRG